MIKLIRRKNLQPTSRKLVRVLGRWCDEIKGRLPFPVECQFYQEKLFWTKHPNCRYCNRQIQFQDWKSGKYNEISKAILSGKNYTFLQGDPIQEFEVKV